MSCCGVHDGVLRVPSVALGDLDLLRAGKLDTRAVTLLDPTAHANAAVFEFFRLYAGGGALDVATALLALRAGVIPPTTGVGAAAAGLRLDLVCREPRPAPLATALVLARGHGGFNAAVVVSAVPASRRGPANQQQEEARCTSSPQMT